MQAGTTAKIKFAHPRATFNQNSNLHVKSTSSTGISESQPGPSIPQFGKNHAAVFEISNPEAIKGAGKRLTIKLHFERQQRNTTLAACAFPRKHSGQPQNLPLLQEGEIRSRRGGRVPSSSSSPWGPGQENEPIDKEAHARSSTSSSTIRTGPTLQSRLKCPRSPRKPASARRRRVMVCSEGLQAHAPPHQQRQGFPTSTRRVTTSSAAIRRRRTAIARAGIPQGAHARGNEPGGAVAQGSKREQGRHIHPKRSGVANWITDVENGAGHLLARVIVNRLWQHHFGRGLVEIRQRLRVPRHASPTHPELLDYLAQRPSSRTDGELKRLHKKIMLSQVYRQGSIGPQNAENAQARS